MKLVRWQLVDPPQPPYATGKEQRRLHMYMLLLCRADQLVGNGTQS